MRDSQAMMEACGFKRLPDGDWNDDEMHWLFDQIDKHGVDWAYRRIKQSRLSFASR